MGKDATQPVERPEPRSLVVDVPKWLKRKSTFHPQLVPGAAERKGCRTGRTALVEDDELGLLIATELKSQDRQKDGFTGAGRANDQAMTDVADMQRQAKGSRAL